MAPASTPLSPLAERIAAFLTAEGVPFERDAIDPSIRVNREFMRGHWGYSNMVSSPWGQFHFSDDFVLLQFSLNNDAGPASVQGDPLMLPAAVAREWLQRQRPDLVSLIDRGVMQLTVDESPTRTALSYARIRGPGEVSVFPLEFSIFVRVACQCVYFFGGDGRDFARTVPPRLDEAAARAVIERRYRRVSIDRLELEEQLTETSSRAVYVARITVALPGVYDTHPHILWVFDADTGETISRLGDPTEANIERPLPAGVSP